MSESLRILILEDRPADAELIQFELQEAEILFTAKVVMTEKDFITALDEYCPDIILSDYDLPAYNGALALAEARRRCPDTPFILVTGAVSEDRAIDILTQGAKDYVLKNRLKQRLAPAVRRALVEAEELKARKKAEEELREAHRSLEERVKIRTAELETQIAARNKTEDVLREAYDRTTAILESIADAFYSLDDQWRFVVVNPAAEQAPFGQPASKLLGKVIWDVFPAIVGTRIHQHYLDAVEKRSQEHYEAQSPLNGRWYEVFMFPRERGLDVYLRDVDDRKKVEDRLHQALDLLEAVTTEAGVTIATRDINLRYTYFNKAHAKELEKITGKSPCLGMSLAEEFEHMPDQLRIASNEWHRTLRGEDRRYETELGNPGRYRRHYSILRAPLRDSGGRIIGAGVLGWDITERKQAEEAVRRSQKTFYELVERSPFGTYVINSKFRIAQMNASSQTGAFLNVRPVIGRDFTEAMRILWPEPVAAEIISHFRHTLETGEPYYSPRFTNPRHDIEIVESYEWELHRMMLPDGQYGVICYYFDSTKLREAEEALRKSEEQYRNLVKHAPTGICDVNFAARRFTEVNDAMCQILGYTRDELLSMDILDILDGEGRALYASRIRRAQSGERLNEAIEYQVRTKEGRLIWALLSTTFHWEAGMIKGATVVAYDITERKNAEEKLRNRERLLQDVMDSSTSPIFLKDIDGKFITINTTLERMLGMSREDIKGKTDYDITSREVADYWRTHDKEVIKTGKAIQMEEVADLQDGHHVFLANKFPLVDAQGQIYGVGAISHDITERKQREKDQEKFNRMLQALKKSSQAMVQATDERAYMEEICKIVVEDCGHAMVWIGFAEDNVGKTVRPVAYSGFEQGYIETLKITWADTERGLGPTGTAIREGKISMCRNMVTEPLFKPWREEALKRGYASSIVLPLVSGNKAFGALTIYSKEPDSFTEDEVKLLAELASDLSYGIMAIRLQTARASAEEALNERTVQLENTNKELESFSYSVSHDLRAPLRAIDGYSRMILKQQGDRFDEKTRDQFDVIIKNTKMMGQLIDDLLALSRLGREALSISKLNMGDLTRDVWEELKANNPDRLIDMKINHVPPGMGDRSFIKQVLINILSNAVKFTRIREVPIIEVGGYVTEAENVYYVRDNGVGFDMQYHDKLFGVFQRLHSANEYEGTGIGLALIQRIIHRHGGRVWAESKVDEGACFYFTLPRV